VTLPRAADELGKIGVPVKGLKLRRTRRDGRFRSHYPCTHDVADSRSADVP